jgi:hypothetical protein
MRATPPFQPVSTQTSANVFSSSSTGAIAGDVTAIVRQPVQQFNARRIRVRRVGARQFQQELLFSD